MNAKRKSTLVLLGLVALLLALASAAWAVPPVVQTIVTITMTGQQSTGGVTPSTPGGNYQYVYDITTGQSINDTIPVQICTSTANGINSFTYSLTLQFSGPNGNSTVTSGMTVPSDPNFTTDGCQTVDVDIASGPFNSVGNFAGNTQVSVDTFNYTGGTSSPHLPTTDPPNNLAQIQIKVNVTEPTQEPPVCFITDSDFNFLVDCSGQSVDSGNGGRFPIVANKKGIEVATNPGQFYYNVLWTNHTGSDQTVTVTFARSGVNTQGAQAIHASIFPSFPDLNDFNFDLVNSDIPSGSDDLLEGVLVPDGSTLWVDYHLEWAGLGGTSAGAPLTCDLTGTNCFTVQASVSSATTNFGMCTAGACGYLKH